MLTEASSIIKGSKIVKIDGRYLLVRGNTVFIPKKAIYSTIKVYNKDILLLGKFDRVRLLIFDSKNNLISSLDLREMLPILRRDGRVRIKNIIVVYIPFLKKSKISVSIPSYLKTKIDNLIKSGKYSSVNEIVEKALVKFLGDLNGKD